MYEKLVTKISNVWNKSCMKCASHIFSSVDYLSHTCAYSETLQVVTCRSPAETIDDKGTALQKDTWASWTCFYTRVKYLMGVHLWVGIPTTQGWVCIGYVRSMCVCTPGTCGPCMESGCYKWMGFCACNTVQRSCMKGHSFRCVCQLCLLPCDILTQFH